MLEKLVIFNTFVIYIVNMGHEYYKRKIKNAKRNKDEKSSFNRNLLSKFKKSFAINYIN